MIVSFLIAVLRMSSSDYVFSFSSPPSIMTCTTNHCEWFYSIFSCEHVCILVLHIPPNTRTHSHKSRIIAHHLFRHFRHGVNLRTVNAGARWRGEEVLSSFTMTSRRLLFHWQKKLNNKSSKYRFRQAEFSFSHAFLLSYDHSEN